MPVIYFGVAKGTSADGEVAYEEMLLYILFNIIFKCITPSKN